MVERESELMEVLQYVDQNAQRLLQLSPEIFPISSRLALRAKQAATRIEDFQDNEMWEASRLAL